jgi:hypothetical protein
MSQYFPWTFMFWDGQELPGDKAAVITVTCCTGSKGYISGNKTNDIHKSKVIFNNSVKIYK